MKSEKCNVAKRGSRCLCLFLIWVPILSLTRKDYIELGNNGRDVDDTRDCANVGISEPPDVKAAVC